MLDFADLLTVVADGVKRKPNKKPDQQPLPSERAIGEVMGGAEQALNETPATYESKSAAEMGSPFLNEPQQNATAQGVADEPANVDNIETTPPNMGMQVYPRPQVETPQDMPVAPKAERRKLSIDEQIAQAEDEVRSATDAPIKKQSFWKDFGAKLIQGADVFFNGTKAPIVGWGRLKHDAAVDRANAKLNPLLGMKKGQQERDLKQAQIDYTTAKPEIETLKIKQRQTEAAARNEMAMRNYERLVRNEENRNTREGKKTQIKEVDGYLFRAYPNDPSKALEPILDPRTGKQAFNPSNVAQEITFEDGTKAWAKGGQIVAGKFAAERQADQQTFQATENEKNRNERREQFIMNFTQKIANDAQQVMQQAAGDITKLAQWKASQIRQIKSDTDLDDETKTAMIASIENLQ